MALSPNSSTANRIMTIAYRRDASNANVISNSVLSPVATESGQFEGFVRINAADSNDVRVVRTYHLR